MFQSFSFRSNGNGNGGSSTTTEAPAEPTQRNRNRFGGNGSNGFKRPKPGQKQPVDEEIQKESSSSVNAEKPSNGGRNRYRGGAPRIPVSTTPASSGQASASNGSSGVPRPAFNKLNANRRRVKPTTPPQSTNEGSQESGENSQTGQTHAANDAATTSKPRARLPVIGTRPVRPGARVNIRRPGQPTSTTTLAPEASEGSVDEPAGEGTEEETHEVSFFSEFTILQLFIIKWFSEW